MILPYVDQRQCKHSSAIVSATLMEHSLSHDDQQQCELSSNNMSSATLNIAQHEIVSNHSTQPIGQSLGDDMRHDSTCDNSNVAICDLHDKTINADLTHDNLHCDTLTVAEQQNIRSLSFLNSSKLRRHSAFAHRELPQPRRLEDQAIKEPEQRR